MKGSWRSTLVAGLALAFLVVTSQAAAPFPRPDKKKGQPAITKSIKVPAVFDKTAPESVEDLQAIQDHIKKVIKLVTPAVVGIQIGGSSGSGVIIDAEGHVLTAGHVSGKPGQNCRIILPNGKVLKGKSLGQNVRIDSGLLKITDDKADFPYVGKGDSGTLKTSQWVISIGHPGGFKPTRTPVVRLGRISFRSQSIIRTDCTLVGGDSGGPLFDMQGRVIGIHSRIGFSIADNVHVPINTYTETWTRLVKGESWGFDARPNTAFLGVRFGDTSDLKIEKLVEGAPAEKAGLKVGDVIVGVDTTNIKDRDDLFDFLKNKKPDDTITISVKRDGEVVKVKVKLAKRPE
jgi:serine protease Do